MRITAAEGAVAALGASITDASRPPGDTDRRRPDDLAARLAATRFSPDVRPRPNVKCVILSGGPINDLGSGNVIGAQLISTTRHLIARAHAAAIGTWEPVDQLG